MKSRQTPVCRDFPVPMPPAARRYVFLADPNTRSRTPTPARGPKHPPAGTDTYALQIDRTPKPAPGGGNDPIHEHVSTSAGEPFCVRETGRGSASDGFSRRGWTSSSASEGGVLREPTSISARVGNAVRGTALGSASVDNALRGTASGSERIPPRSGTPETQKSPAASTCVVPRREIVVTRVVGRSELQPAQRTTSDPADYSELAASLM